MTLTLVADMRNAGSQSERQEKTFLDNNDDIGMWKAWQWTYVISTWQSTDVHFLEIFRLQDNNSQFSSRRYVSQWEADISQLFLCMVKHHWRFNLSFWRFEIMMLRNWYLNSFPNRIVDDDDKIGYVDTAEEK